MTGCVLQNLTPVRIFVSFVAVHYSLDPHNFNYHFKNTLISPSMDRILDYSSLFAQTLSGIAFCICFTNGGL